MCAREYLTFDDSWAGYLRWAHRLPPAPPPVTPRHISGIAEIIGDFDAVILDNFGVLSLGPPVIPEGPAAYDCIRKAGVAVRVVSNDGSKSISAMCESHRARGYLFEESEIFAGVSLLENMLESGGDGFWAAVGLDPRLIPQGGHDIRAWPDDGVNIDEASGLLLLDCDDFWRKDFAPIIKSFKRHPRPVIVGNPDLTAPYTDAMSLEPGYLAHQLADEAGIEPVFLGKPFAPVYEMAMRDLAHIPAERVLCVGDTLHTDVLGGRARGMKALLVETGFTRGKDPLRLAEESGIWPDFIAPSI